MKYKTRMKIHMVSLLMFGLLTLFAVYVLPDIMIISLMIGFLLGLVIRDIIMDIQLL